MHEIDVNVRKQTVKNKSLYFSFVWDKKNVIMVIHAVITVKRAEVSEWT